LVVDDWYDVCNSSCHGDLVLTKGREKTMFAWTGSFKPTIWIMLVVLLGNSTGVVWSQQKPTEGSVCPKIHWGFIGRLQPGWGFMIERVEPGSTAEKIGMQAGDLIVEINGVPVRSTGQYYRLTEKARGKIFFTIEQTPTGKICKRALFVRETGTGMEITPFDPEFDGENLARQSR
jgi:membrane-associated protease RseP (regulator of RpoE activity)